MRDLTKYRLASAGERLELSKIALEQGSTVTMLIFSLHRVKRQRNNINTRSSSLRLSRNIWRRRFNVCKDTGDKLLPARAD